MFQFTFKRAVVISNLNKCKQNKIPNNNFEKNENFESFISVDCSYDDGLQREE